MQTSCLAGMFFPRSLGWTQGTRDSEASWVGRGQGFLLARALCSSSWAGGAGGCSTLGGALEKKMALGLEQGGRERQAWPLWDRVGGETSFWVSPSLENEEAPLQLLEGGEDKEGTKKVAGTGQDPAVRDLSLAVLHPSIFQRLLSEFLVFLKLPPLPPLLQPAASVSLPLRLGLQFFPEHFWGIPLTTGTGGSGTRECATSLCHQ